MSALRKMSSYAKGHKLAYGCCLILGISAQIVALVQPRLSGDLIASVQKNDSITYTAVSLGLLVVVEAILVAIQQAILGRIGEGTVYEIRRQMVDKFFHMKMLDRERNPPAWYSQRISNDAALVKSVPSQCLGVVQSAILIVGSGLALIKISFIVFLIVLLPAIASVLFVGFTGKPIKKKLQNNVQEATMGMTLNVQEAASAMRMLKAYNAIDQEEQKLFAVISRAYESGKRLVYLYSSLGPVAQILSQIANILAILYGAYQVARGQMEFTSLVMFLMYFSFFSSATTSLVSSLSQLQQAIVGKQRVSELLGVEEDTDDSRGIEFNLSRAPRVAFDKVDHQYPDQQKQSLNRITFEAPSERTTALVGESGGGKTTCLSLMERFFAPTAGKITINGRDLSNLEIDSLREGTAYVEQDPCILTGTIRDNVKLGNLEATDQEVSSVLKMVGLHIAGTSEADTLDCQVGESGLSLSGGQKQRIALSRALIRKPKLLLMDEPTSNLDGIAEEGIAELIRNKFKETTVIYSAHRLSLILEADWIVVIREGSVLAEGRHDDLMQTCEYYQQLINAQMHHSDE